MNKLFDGKVIVHPPYDNGCNLTEHFGNVFLLTLFVALAISTVAIITLLLGVIFAGALPIAIMGVVLEVGKLVVASWTFQNWKTTAL